MEKQVMLVLDSESVLGEGPHWDYERNKLYWIDISAKKLHIYDPEKNDNQSIQFDGFIGAAVPERSGELILAMQNGLYRYNLEASQLTKLENPEKEKINNRFNLTQQKFPTFI